MSTPTAQRLQPSSGSSSASSVPQQRRVRTEIPGPRSRELAARQAEAVSSALTAVLPVYVAQAAGGILEDVDGNRFIDFGSGIAVTTVGNAAAEVVDRVTAQAARFTHTCAMVNPYESYVQVCERLNEATPGTHAKRSVLFSTGAEAVENAVKVARAATGRPAVVVLDHAYHGRTLLTMAMTAKHTPYKHGFGPFAPEVYRVPTADPFRWPTGPDRCAEEAAQAAIERIETQVGAHRVAAFVAEPIHGEAGFIVPAEGFLPRMQEYCRDNGILFIADEVQTGLARTGRWFACEHEGLEPDLVTTAKGLGGGLPLAAVTGRREVMDAVHPGGLGGTFSGNPVACEAALGVMEAIDNRDLVARAAAIGKRMLTRLGTDLADTPTVGEVRGRGAMVAIEFVGDGPDRPPSPAAMQAAVGSCHEAGVMVLTAGTHGNVMRFLPPLVISDELLDEGLDVIVDAVRA